MANNNDIPIYGALRSKTGEGKAAYASQIYDEARGKFQDEINNETANDGLVSAKVAQTFTTAEKQQARTNIGAYTKPSSGIPKSDLASDVRTSLESADTAYQKPSDGIPSSDMSESVQISLGKADTALQEHQDISMKEDKSNKVTSLSSQSTNTQYPSAKAVYDIVGDIESLLSAI